METIFDRDLLNSSLLPAAYQSLPKTEDVQLQQAYRDYNRITYNAATPISPSYIDEQGKVKDQNFAYTAFKYIEALNMPGNIVNNFLAATTSAYLDTGDWGKAFDYGVQGVKDAITLQQKDYMLELVQNHLMPNEPGELEATGWQQTLAFALSMPADLLSGHLIDKTLLRALKPVRDMMKPVDVEEAISKGWHLVDKVDKRLKRMSVRGEQSSNLYQLLTIKRDRFEDMIMRAEAGDEKAGSRLLKQLTSDQYSDPIQYMSEKELLKEREWMRTLGGKNETKNERIYRREVKQMRAEGHVEFTLNEMDGFIAHTPFEAGNRVFDLNTVDDIDLWVTDLEQGALKQLTKTRENIIASGDKAKLQYFDELLATQRTRLERTFSHSIHPEMTNEEAYAHLVAVDQVAQVANTVVQNKPYAFVSPIDMIKWLKSIAVYGALKSRATGQIVPVSRLMSVLDTSVIKEIGEISQVAKVMRLESRLPMISPKSAQIAKDVGGVKGAVKKAGRPISAEDFAKARQKAAIGIVKGGGTKYNEPEAIRDLIELAQDPEASKLFLSATHMRRRSTPKVLQDSWELMRTLHSRAQVNSFINNMYNPDWSEKMYSYWVNSVLSGYTTHMKNTLDNATTTLLMPFKLTASAIVNPKEASSRLKAAAGAFGAIGESAMDNFRVIKHSGVQKGYKNESSLIADGKTMLDARLRSNTIYISKYDTFGVKTVEDYSKLGPEEKAQWLTAHVIEYPTKMLQHEDAVFSSLNIKMFKHADANRRAAIATDDPVEFERLKKEILADSDIKTNTDAWELSKRTVYRNDMPQTIERALHYAHAIPGMRYMTPFLRISVQLMRAGFSMTPVPYVTNFISKRYLGRTGFFANNPVVKDLAAGGTRAALAQGQIAMANSTFMGMLMLPTEGVITGGGGLPMPDSRRTPYKPYTLFFPDGSSIYYGDVIALRFMLGVPITIKEVIHQIDWSEENNIERTSEFVTSMATVFAGALSDRFGLWRISQAMDGVQELARDGNGKNILKFAASIATGFVPYSGLLRDTNRNLIHDAVRESDGIIDTVLNRFGLGGMGENPNPQAIDLFGNRRYYSFTGKIQGVNTSGNDPITLELRRLRVNIPDVPTSAVINGQSTKLTLEQRMTMRQLVANGALFGGDTYKNALRRVMTSREYLIANNDQRRNMVKRLTRVYIDAAKAYVLNRGT